MGTKFFLAGVFALGVFFSTEGQACECMSWLTTQQLASKPGAIVARVRTIAIDEQAKADLQIEEVYKGDIGQATRITAQAGDGGSCNGGVLTDPSVPFVVVLHPDGKSWDVGACGENLLAYDKATDTITLPLEPPAKVNEQDFKRYLDFELQPTIHGVSCEYHVMRTLLSSNEASFNEYEWMTTSGGVLELDKHIDFSSQDKNVGVLTIKAVAESLGKYQYRLTTQVQDPFFSQSFSKIDFIDIREHYLTDGVYRDHHEELSNGQVRYYSTSVTCGLNAGAPLIETR